MKCPLHEVISQAQPLYTCFFSLSGRLASITTPPFSSTKPAYFPESAAGTLQAKQLPVDYVRAPVPMYYAAVEDRGNKMDHPWC